MCVCVCVCVCVCLQVPNQRSAGMLTEPQTATGNLVLSFALNLIYCLLTNIRTGVWACCDYGQQLCSFLAQQVLSIFLVLLGGQRSSAQCQGHVTPCHFDKCGLVVAALIRQCQLTSDQSQDYSLKIEAPSAPTHYLNVTMFLPYLFCIHKQYIGI